MAQIFEILFNVIGPIFLVIGFAVFIGRTFAPDPRSLSTLLIYLFLPALAFRGMATAALESDLIGIMLVSILIHLIMAVIGVFVARLLRLDPRAAGAFVLSVMMINAANYGIPFNQFAFGDAGAENAIVFWVVSSIIGNLMGVYFASRGSGGLRHAVNNVLRVPIAYATILGLIFNVAQISLPLPVERSINILADAGIPGMLTLLGLQLARAKLSGNMKTIMVAVGLRLFVSPLIGLGLALMLGMHTIPLNVAVLQSGMPTAVVATAFALQFGSDAEFTTSVTLVSTLLSVVTLTLLLLMLGGVVA